jgi:large subunit ribosomal protein L2
VTKKEPERSLLTPIKKTGGRNHKGVITVRDAAAAPSAATARSTSAARPRRTSSGTVVGIEYDPNRSCHIALIEYEDGVKRYIIAPVGLKDGMTVISSSDGPVEPEPGNCMRSSTSPWA